MRVLGLACVLVGVSCGRSSLSSGETVLDRETDSSAVTPAATLDPGAFLPPEPAVDLDASIRAAVASAAVALGRKTIVHTEIDAFVLVNADGGARYATAVALARKALVALYNGRFDRHPTRAVTVFVYTSETAYEAFCAGRSGGHCPTAFGAYQRSTRSIVMHATPGAETTLHEMVHPLVSADFPRAPAWLDEGIASLYEAPVFCGEGHITGVQNWRMPPLRDALDSPGDAGTPSIEALFSMDTVAFLTLDPARLDAGATDPVLQNLHYATARYFVQWMDRRGWLWPFYRAWRDGIATDPEGRKALQSTISRNPGEVQADWEAYVRSLARPGSDPPCAAPRKKTSTDL